MSVALQLPIQFASLPSPASAYAGFMAALANLDKKADDVVKEATAAAAKAEAQIADAVAGMEANLDLIEKGVAAGARVDPAPAIEMLEAIERQVGSDLRTSSQVMRRTLKMMMKIRPQVAKKLEPLVDHYESGAPKYLERIRDMRWRLMALGAEQVRDERGPVFDNAKDLERYLDSLN